MKLSGFGRLEVNGKRLEKDLLFIYRGLTKMDIVDINVIG